MCKVPLFPKIERGNSPVSSLSAASFSVLPAEESPCLHPQSLKPRGRGGAFQNHRMVSTQDKLTHGHTLIQKLTIDRPLPISLPL